MARYMTAQLTGVCTVISFFYVSQTVERHSLTEQPRLSALLVLFVSGCICFLASHFPRWLPAAEGRFGESQPSGLDGPLLASDGPLLKGSSGHLPARPRKFFLPALVACIVCRIEILHSVNLHQQCATPGVESFLCILLISYEIFSTRGKWTFPPPDDPDDPWRSLLHDLYDWFSGPRVNLFIMASSAALFSFGTFLAVGQFTRSTYVCFRTIESRSSTRALQCLGLLLDFAIVVFLWRILAWTKSVKLQLRTLGTILTLASLFLSIFHVAGTLYAGSRGANAGSSLFASDILVDGIAYACLLIGATFWVCETSPITPAAVITCIVGIWRSSSNMFMLGDWQHVAPGRALAPLWLVTIGVIFFTYFHDLRSVLFLRRAFLAVLLLCLLIAATIFSVAKQPESFQKRHPINDLVYQAGIDHDRWLSHATTSKSFPVAVTTYQERHEGRAPPPHFAEWFQSAQGSTIIDEFGQIDKDLEVFWSVPAKVLRERADLMTTQPGVAILTIKAGKVTRGDSGGAAMNQMLERLVKTVEPFSQHLPDMVLPINLESSPRILPPWEETASRGHADMSVMADLISRRITNHTLPFSNLRDELAAYASAAALYTSTTSLGYLLSEACPPRSLMRTNPHADVAEFCSACIEKHSRGQLLTKLEKSLELCSQPDMKHLHSFFLSNPMSPPIRQLLPLFGPSKTDGFRDIMIPLPASVTESSDNSWQFDRKYDRLIWRGQVAEHDTDPSILGGGHKYRLLHLVNDADGRDKVTMVLPHRYKKQKFVYEKLAAVKANDMMPFSFGLDDYSACTGDNCKLVKDAYGITDHRADPLEYRYVLLLDEDDGPPREFMRTLRSLSVPFVSTIFQTWYTERLSPWLHFVPIDPRYQALYTTLAYFTGTTEPRGSHADDDGDDDGGTREREGMKGRREDAEWIALQGRKWADKALGQKEMEVYMSRLLLEWGRLIDDGRDDIGVYRGEDGEFRDTGWTVSGVVS